MSLRKTEHVCMPRRPIGAPPGHSHFAALTAVGAAPAVLLLWLVWFVAPALVLPALSIASFAIAAAAALFAHYAGIDRHAPGVTAWDVAAVFAAIWVLAGLIGGAAPFTAVFDHPASDLP